MSEEYLCNYKPDSTILMIRIIIYISSIPELLNLTATQNKVLFNGQTISSSIQKNTKTALIPTHYSLALCLFVHTVLSVVVTSGVVTPPVTFPVVEQRLTLTCTGAQFPGVLAGCQSLGTVCRISVTFRVVAFRLRKDRGISEEIN